MASSLSKSDLKRAKETIKKLGTHWDGQFITEKSFCKTYSDFTGQPVSRVDDIKKAEFTGVELLNFSGEITTLVQSHSRERVQMALNAQYEMAKAYETKISRIRRNRSLIALAMVLAAIVFGICVKSGAI